MTKIVVPSPEVREMKGIGKTSGKPYHMRIQTAYLYPCDDAGTFGEFPDKFEISLEENQQPYPRGHYQLHPSSVRISRDGRIEVRPRLVAIPSAKNA